MFYKDWQNFLLEKELGYKKKLAAKCKDDLLSAHANVKCVLSWLDLNNHIIIIYHSQDSFSDTSFEESDKYTVREFKFSKNSNIILISSH